MLKQTGNVKKIILCNLIFLIYNTCMSQVAIGPFVSTNNITAADFNRTGGGIMAEVSNNFNFSLAYFGKGSSKDSIFFMQDNGSPAYLHYVEKFRFIHISASFSLYLAGGERFRKKVFRLYRKWPGRNI